MGGAGGRLQVKADVSGGPKSFGSPGAGLVYKVALYHLMWVMGMNEHGC